MPDNLRPKVFGFPSGFATDLPTFARDLQYFLRMENVIFETVGVRKVGGSTKVNAVAMSGEPDVTGMFDFWKAGVGGSFSQKYVAVTSDGKVYKDDMDGTFDDITGAATITADAIPIFCQARDTLLIFTSANDTPLKWDQTGNVATLGGTPPAGRGAVFHNNRVWTWGQKANPSRLTFGSSTTAEDYIGADTGSLDIDPEDGDVIVGACSYKKVLFVFKGPNKGSIHQILGTAPTGSDGFSRGPTVRGIALQSHNSIIPAMDDIFFMSDRGVHSLSATQQYGNFAQADITRYLKGFFRDQLNRSLLNKVWGVDYADKSCLVWVVPSDGASENDTTFGLSYIRLQEEGWKPFTWNRGGTSCAIRINPAARAKQVNFGTTDGFVATQDTSGRNIYDTTAYSMRVTTPQLLIGEGDAAGKQRGDIPVNLERMYLRSIASGDYDISCSVLRFYSTDEQSSDTYTFNQGNAGFLLDTSSLDIGALGGTSVQLVYSEPPAKGTARSIQFDITQGGLNEDANLLEFGVDYTPIAQSNKGA